MTIKHLQSLVQRALALRGIRATGVDGKERGMVVALNPANLANLSLPSHPWAGFPTDPETRAKYTLARAGRSAVPTAGVASTFLARTLTPGLRGSGSGETALRGLLDLGRRLLQEFLGLSQRSAVCMSMPMA